MFECIAEHAGFGFSVFVVILAMGSIALGGQRCENNALRAERKKLRRTLNDTYGFLKLRSSHLHKVRALRLAERKEFESARSILLDRITVLTDWQRRRLDQDRIAMLERKHALDKRLAGCVRPEAPK